MYFPVVPRSIKMSRNNLSLEVPPWAAEDFRTRVQRFNEKINNAVTLLEAGHRRASSELVSSAEDISKAWEDRNTSYVKAIILIRDLIKERGIIFPDLTNQQAAAKNLLQRQYDEMEKRLWEELRKCKLPAGASASINSVPELVEILDRIADITSFAWRNDFGEVAAFGKLVSAEIEKVVNG